MNDLQIFILWPEEWPRVTAIIAIVIKIHLGASTLYHSPISPIYAFLSPAILALLCHLVAPAADQTCQPLHMEVLATHFLPQFMHLVSPWGKWASCGQNLTCKAGHNSVNSRSNKMEKVRWSTGCREWLGWAGCGSGCTLGTGFHVTKGFILSCGSGASCSLRAVVYKKPLHTAGLDWDCVLCCSLGASCSPRAAVCQEAPMQQCGKYIHSYVLWGHLLSHKAGCRMAKRAELGE